MGYNAYVMDCCGQAVFEGWECDEYCEGCGAHICEECIDDGGYERDEHSELWECPCCDQFRHMTKEYSA